MLMQQIQLVHQPMAFIAEQAAGKASDRNSFQLKVPQMLNQISWWLPNVSMEYEE